VAEGVAESPEFTNNVSHKVPLESDRINRI
jgi:hypothetical protein